MIQGGHYSRGTIIKEIRWPKPFLLEPGLVRALCLFVFGIFELIYLKTLRILFMLQLFLLQMLWVASRNTKTLLFCMTSFVARWLFDVSSEFDLWYTPLLSLKERALSSSAFSLKPSFAWLKVKLFLNRKWKSPTTIILCFNWI